MKFLIGDIEIYFPYETIYPEQLKYIHSIINSIKEPGHCLIEMPSGTGKTVALLSSTVSYLLYSRAMGIPFKIIYCSRTVPEIDKALSELKNLINYIKKYHSFDFLGLGLSRRSNMCINDQALNSFDLDLICRKMVNKIDGLKCDFFENTTSSEIPNGVFNFEDLRNYGKERGICPYFFVRNALTKCDCVIYTYNYLIDPVIYSIISKDLTKDSFVIFDEAHNIDSHCIEALSMEIERNTLEASTRVLSELEKKVKHQHNDFKNTIDKEILNQRNTFLEVKESKKMKKIIDYNVEGTIPYFFNDKKFEFAPGNLRSSIHFVRILKRLIEFYKTKLKTTHLTVESIKSFIQSIEELTLIDKKTLKFCSQRLGMLIQSLNYEDDELHLLKRVADFSTMLSIYSKGFSVIFEPYDSMASVFNPILRLSCLDCSIAMSHVFERFRNVIITSGTLSPIEMYPKILNFNPTNIFEISATLDRNSISPLIVVKGNDQMLLKGKIDDEFLFNFDFNIDNVQQTKDKISTSFKVRTDPSVVRNYGNLLIQLSKTVPDNIVCFFPSYIYMEEIVSIWSETEVIKEILQNKLIFIETPNFKETSLALKNYRQACDNGRGAILLSVARGKVSEGVDFELGYGRAVVMLGIPYMYTESVRLKERLRYLKTEYNIKEYDFLVFDAMRHAAQCLGRILRTKNDYGLMLMADHRFAMQNKISKLPKWIQEKIEKGNVGLSIDMAINIAKVFFREMAQPCDGKGNSLLESKDVEVYLSKLNSNLR